MHYLSIILLVGFISACKSESSQTAGKNSGDCKYNIPVAMLSDTLDSISEHRFVKDGDQSIEFMTLTSGRKIELLQRGCNELEQEFRFMVNFVPQDGTAKSWAIIGASELQEFSKLHPNLTNIGLWSQEIKKNADKFSLREPLQLVANFYASIDHLKKDGNDWVIVTLIGK